MKKYFLYELRKSLFLILIYLVCATCIYAFTLLSIPSFTVDIGDGIKYMNSNVGTAGIVLIALCILTPILNFAFKMNSRSVDAFYSFPITRDKLYFIKCLVGLIEIIIPFTIMYWLGFLTLIFKGSGLNFVEYLPLYFISISLAVMLYGINAFIFTRANSIIDGIIFIVFYTVVLAIFLESIWKILPMEAFMSFGENGEKQSWYNNSVIDWHYWFTVSPITYTYGKYKCLIEYAFDFKGLRYEWIMYAFFGLASVASYLALILGAKNLKAENAEQVSESYFGYKTMIPVFLIIIIATGEKFSTCIYTMVCGIALYIIYRRSFKLNRKDLIVLGGAYVIGWIIFLIQYFA